MSTGTRVSVSTNVSETVRNIMEITVNHSEEEVYAMLKECSMDPNETIQRLIHQGTFHEVRRKRDKKKEIPTNKEPVDTRPRSAPFVRLNRANRGNYSPRNSSQGTVTSAMSRPAASKDKETLPASTPAAAPPAVNAHKRAHVPSKGKAAAAAPPPIPSSSQLTGPPKSGGKNEIKGKPAAGGGNHENAVAAVVKSLSGFNIHSQLTGPPKGMEWKPKPLPIPLPIPPLPAPIPVSTASDPPADGGDEVGVMPLEKSPKKQHVIIPNHIHVPESERNKLSFGSIDTWFGENAGSRCTAVRERTPVPSGPDDPSILQHSGEMTSSTRAESLLLSPSSSSGGDVDATPVPTEQHKRRDTPPSPAPAAVISGYHPGGFVHGNPAAVDPQTRGDAARLPGFLVPQQFDAPGYYDGRVSPFAPPKFSAAAQEVGGSQPFPIFRQPAGIHMTAAAAAAAGMHYPPPPPLPPNYVHYIAPPFYVSPTAIHQILTSNTAAANFSHHHHHQQQQQQAGSLYPQAIPGLKYSYKPGMLPPLGGYIPYGTGPTSSAVNDDLSPQYNTQQNEGPGVWVAAPVRDMSAMQSTSFYGLPPQAGYVPAPTQAVTAALLQQAQSSMGGGGAVSGDVTGGAVFQHVPANWANGY